MFYDLNVPWSPTDPHLPRTLAFLHELGYNVLALTHTLSGKLPTDLTSPIPNPLPHQNLPPKLTILRRVTLVLTDTHQNARLAALARNYDLLAVRPVDEKSLQLACGSLDCGIISLDLSQRYSFFFKHKMLNEAIRSGKKIELCYSQGVVTGDPQARRNLIGNATQLIRATRGRGLVLSSECKVGAVGCRGPWDAINLAAIWGLGQERGFEAMSKEARSCVVAARLRRTGYRGLVDVVYGGEKPVVVEEEKAAEQGGKQKPGQGMASQGQKRKADDMEGGKGDGAEKPMSKRAAKKLARQARLEGGDNGAGAPTTARAPIPKLAEPNAQGNKSNPDEASKG